MPYPACGGQLVLEPRLGLSLEIGYQQRRFSTDTWTLELRPVIDKQIGPWYVAFNPVLGRSLQGDGVKQGRGCRRTTIMTRP